ncbi:uncharacterized protein JN550_004722 [Neoarthrinium moseri]|uniref:uncharacterized protein n=1 Tax=Neoarthrinium moseri TaxID=1658444 RepID=UPI001FDB6779|nr:uncharacterized protein JN550_004722 [Neoarthrinium moseri]KAI1871277.1 hypothetical protein JN550_004722 [Neoarthrinium moseri]
MASYPTAAKAWANAVGSAALEDSQESSGSTHMLSLLGDTQTSTASTQMPPRLGEFHDHATKASHGSLLDRSQFEKPEDLTAEGFTFKPNQLHQSGLSNKALQDPRGKIIDTQISMEDPRSSMVTEADKQAGHSPAAYQERRASSLQLVGVEQHTSAMEHGVSYSKRDSGSNHSFSTVEESDADQDSVRGQGQPASSDRDSHLGEHGSQVRQETNKGQNAADRLLKGQRLDVERPHILDPSTQPSQDRTPQDDYSHAPFPPEDMATDQEEQQPPPLNKRSLTVVRDRIPAYHGPLEGPALKSSAEQSPVQTPVGGIRHHRRHKQERSSKGIEVFMEPETTHHIHPSDDKTTPARRPRESSVMSDLSFKPPMTTRQRRQIKPSKTSSRGMANRPLAVPTSSQLSMRPISRGSNLSNISRRRTTPSSRKSEPLTPLKEAYIELGEYREQFAGCWNGYFFAEQKYKQRVIDKMARLEDTVQAYEDQLEQLENERRAQNQIAEQLQNANQDLTHQLKASEGTLTAQATNIERLIKKCDKYRGRLNDATKEQQKLYTKSKEHVNETIERLKAEQQELEKSRQASLDATVKKSEAARDDLQRKVRDVVNLARQQALELDGTIKVLKADLESSQQQLSRERDHTQSLQKELQGSRDSNAHIIMNLRDQNSKILEALEHQKIRDQEAQSTASRRLLKLDSIGAVIDELKSKATDPSSVTQEIQSLRQHVSRDIITEIQHLASKIATAGDSGQAHDATLNEIKTICESISEHSHHHGQEAQRWQELHKQAETKLQDLKSKMRDTQEKLEEATEFNGRFNEENIDLKDSIASQQEHINELQAELNVHEARGDSEAAEVARLKQLLKENDSAFKRLEEEARQSKEQLQVQSGSLEEAEKARQDLQQTIDTAAEKQNTAIQNATQQFEQKHRDIESRFEASEKSRAKLEQELQKAKERAQRLSSTRSDDIPRLMREEINRVNELVSHFKAMKEDIQGLEPISHLHDGLINMHTVCKSLEKDFSNAAQVKEKIVELIGVEQKQLEVLKTQASSQQTKDDNVTLPEKRTSFRSKRVAFEETSTAAPLDTVENQSSRKGTKQPLKSCIRTTRSTSKEPEAAAQHVSMNSTVAPSTQQRPVVSSHSSFNRPVQGGHLANASIESRKRAATELETEVPKSDGKRQRLPFAPQAMDTVLPGSGRSGSSRSRSQSKSDYFQIRNSVASHRETELDEGDMAMPTISDAKGAATRGPLATRSGGIITYGTQSRTGSQSSAASSQTLRGASQTPMASDTSMPLSGSQEHKLPYKLRREQ